VEETIVAPATPPGRGGVSVVRLSGPSAPQIGELLCGELPEPWCFKPCSILNNKGGLLDTGLVVFFAAPKSYTGEDVVEVHCHGNPLIVDSIVAEAVFLGARIAEPGEFTKRAFLNDKIDLTQAESVADLIAAQTSSALVAANSSLSGSFSSLINRTIDEVVGVRVVVEACLDFSDEESVSAFEEKRSLVRQGVVESLRVVGSLLDSSRVGSKMREGLGVVILGPPNCGKSTLLNALAKEDVAIVSDTPGTTRDLLRVVLDLGGLPVEFTDTAGLREDTKEEVEIEGMRRAVSATDGADLVVLMSCVGETFNPPTPPSTKTLRVFNKIDVFPDRPPLGVGEVFISALTGENLDKFIEAVFNCFGVGPGIEVPVLARRRHLSFLEKALFSLESSLSVLDGDGDLVLAAEDLKQAQSFLGFITRPVTSDELLGEIFSEFCIGK
tara:strand:- start:2196 stop:3518 length:1323 start_codon:yes stop_codon:yes gene_type:complete